MMGRKVAEMGIEDSFVKAALLCGESLRWISVSLRYLVLIPSPALDLLDWRIFNHL
jgi:hypothetical protein